jgi:hypothetical protein
MNHYGPRTHLHEASRTTPKEYAHHTDERACLIDASRHRWSFSFQARALCKEPKCPLTCYFLFVMRLLNSPLCSRPPWSKSCDDSMWRCCCRNGKVPEMGLVPTRPHPGSVLIRQYPIMVWRSLTVARPQLPIIIFLLTIWEGQPMFCANDIYDVHEPI